jgi:hypothetical protein
MPPAKWEISAGDFPCLNSFFGCSAAAFKRLQSAGSSTPHLVSRPVPNNAAQFLFSARRFRLDFDRPHSPLQRCGVQFWGLGSLSIYRAILVLLDTVMTRQSVRLLITDVTHVEDSIYMARVYLEHFEQGFKLSTVCFW